ncbi:polymorphic toxin-type HINT domain-containing protein [Streptomyces sp. NPDC005408]|uniref:polymorphic toxin-type HINT domain-containing protein n=1 Tax=Streptomyces sp. NPDC005408 TaxID=3155341 RepID=UPI0033A59736
MNYNRVDGGNYWESIVGDGDRTGMACFGRAACREAWRHLTNTHDVAAAKRIAATYCLIHAKRCAGENRDYDTTQKVLDALPGLLATVYGIRLAKPVPGRKCFLAGTDVLMADRTTKDIEDVKVGDKVLATDPETGETGKRKVTRLIVTEDDKLFNELTIATDEGHEKLTATHEHPFWSPSEKKWVEAGQLRPGMTLLTIDGSRATVQANRAYTKHARTYNLTVDDLHTYYVLAGVTPVLVHNSGGGIPPVDNARLQGIVNALFHGVGNANLIGDGSAMAAANQEALGGAQVEGRNHLTSTTQLRSSLNNFLTKDVIRLKGGKKEAVVRTARDIQVANSLISAIDDAHAGKYSGLGGYAGLGGCS